MTDHLSALRNYLLGQQEVTDLCGRAIYVLAMPQAELVMPDPVTQLPRGQHKVAVLLASGGALGRMRGTVTEARTDIVCFGETDWDAAQFENAVADAMKSLTRQTVLDGSGGAVLLYGATVAQGPMQSRDPITFWPCMRRQYILRADERQIGGTYATV
jgi:hypothetical protein